MRLQPVSSQWNNDTLNQLLKSAHQQTFPWYNPSDYQPMANPNWPDPSLDPLGVLNQLLDDAPQGVIEFVNHYNDIYNPQTISFQNTCVSPSADPITVIQVGKSRYVVDVDLEKLEPIDDWFRGLWDVSSYAPCPDQNAEFWDAIHPGPGTFLYHATNPDNLENIKRKGLRASSDTRSMSNKSMGDAVFTSWNEHSIDSYGSLVITIDVGLMKADGFMPRVSKEEPFEEEEMRSALAHKLGIEFDAYSEYASEGLSEETVAFYGNIPPKYLAFPD